MAALDIINSQGMTLWINTTVPSSTPTYSDVSTAGVEVACPQAVGDLTQTRAVTEYKCMSSNDSAKSLGSIERGNIEVEMLFDPADSAGQDAIKTAFSTNAQVLVGIELPDGVVNGTTFAFTGAISSVSVGIAQDEAVKYTATIEIASDVTEIALADT